MDKIDIRKSIISRIERVTNPSQIPRTERVTNPSQISRIERVTILSDDAAARSADDTARKREDLLLRMALFNQARISRWDKLLWHCEYNRT